MTSSQYPQSSQQTAGSVSTGISWPGALAVIAALLVAAGAFLVWASVDSPGTGKAAGTVTVTGVGKTTSDLAVLDATPQTHTGSLTQNLATRLQKSAEKAETAHATKAGYYTLALAVIAGGLGIAHVLGRAPRPTAAAISVAGGAVAAIALMHLTNIPGRVFGARGLARTALNALHPTAGPGLYLTLAGGLLLLVGGAWAYLSSRPVAR
ncbi:hypothetical protein [Nocardia africana]|uniref:Uncharacterized protein n=1 Tax=Nocardia africana TaxID=134964 RepID=A0A378WUU8_9NOCA|nr:hypothetical protein [Nocardia africana]MCC3313690.1 hypothetical protein [Nocardia africana]SUA44929.1 Uncharacterised protein [Nocardia africana]